MRQDGVHLRVQALQEHYGDGGREGRQVGGRRAAVLLQARQDDGQAGAGRDQPGKCSTVPSLFSI